MTEHLQCLGNMFTKYGHMKSLGGVFKSTLYALFTKSNPGLISTMYQVSYMCVLLCVICVPSLCGSF